MSSIEGSFLESEIIKNIRKKEIMKVGIDREFVDVKKWENVYGIIQEFEGSMQTATMYYGTCPRCNDIVLNDCTIGVYVDPDFFNFCPNCGSDLR